MVYWKRKLKKIENNGISLITLIITIVVIIILSAAVVYSINKSNPIDKANEAVLRNDLQTLKENVQSLSTKKLTDKTQGITNTDLYSALIPSKYVGSIIVDENTGIIGVPDDIDSSKKDIATNMGIITYTKIKTGAELKSTLDANSKANVMLANDITLPVDWNPIADFEGIIDGNGKTISGLNITDWEVFNDDTWPNPSDYAVAAVGFIRNIKANGQVKNLNITGANINAYMAAGAITGVNEGIIQNCNVTSTIKCYEYAGGMVGINGGLIQNCNVTSTVSSTSSAGGLTGFNNAPGIIENCTANTNLDIVTNFVDSATYVTALKGCFAGGICGVNNSTVKNCVGQGSLKGVKSIGGIAGQNYGVAAEIIHCNSNANIEITTDWAGGIAGSNHTSAKIKLSYSTGTVKGVNNIGGFCGLNTRDSLIENCYSTGTVIASGVRVGGFVGRNLSQAIINNSYTTGLVTCTGTPNGGFVGDSLDGVVNTSRWNTETTGKATGMGLGTVPATLLGLTTSQMQSQSNFPGFDFSSVWTMGASGPTLR